MCFSCLSVALSLSLSRSCSLPLNEKAPAPTPHVLEPLLDTHEALNPDPFRNPSTPKP